jgi:hypothetical protein
VKISRLQSSEKGNEKASLPILRGDADVRPQRAHHTEIQYQLQYLK